MTRRIVWIGLLLAMLALLLGLWFVTHFEQVPYQRWEDPGADARRNPFLALERFMERMGRPLQQARDAGVLDTPPPGGVLILDAGRGRHMTPARVDTLLRWVEQGGYLVLAPEASGSPDPLLSRLGVSWKNSRGAPDTDSADGDTASTTPPVVRSVKQMDAGTLVEIPGQTPLRIRADYRQLRSARRPAWQANGPAGSPQVLHFERGSGHITVIGNLGQILHNHEIGKYDHAEVLWTLLDRYQPNSEIRLVRRLATQGLLEWLLEHAWPALLGLAVLLVLWLWQVMPRFAVIAATPVADRRALGEHLAAMGRYLWRAGGLAHWTALTRRNFQQRLALHLPALAALAPAEQADALCRLVNAGSHDRREISHALLGPVLTPLDFTHAQRTLRNLEQALAHGELQREAAAHRSDSGV